jgi:hypothetical protein
MTVGIGSALWAYIDPGTGSLVFQMMVAGLLTLGLMLRGVRDRVTGFLGRVSSLRREDPSATGEPTIATQPRPAAAASDAKDATRRSRAA